MTHESRIILEAIRDCRTKAEAELVVKLHGFHMRAYKYGSYVSLGSPISWDVLLHDTRVQFHHAGHGWNKHIDACPYRELPVVLSQ